MPPLHVTIDPCRFTEDDLLPAVDTLGQGGILVFPTETVYGIGTSPESAASAEKIYSLKNRPPGKPLTRYLAAPEDLQERVPIPCAQANRLIRAFWPGPLTLVTEDRDGQSAGFRCADHPVLQALLRDSPKGLEGTSANLSGGPDPVTPQTVPPSLIEGADVFLSSGPCEVGVPSTVARASSGSIEVLREGAVSARAVTYFDYLSILFVCTGNTCRSPMAQALLRHRVGEALSLPAGALADAGILIHSAGTHAYGGAAASFNGVLAVEEVGADLRGHLSRPVDPVLVEEADIVVAMTLGHESALRRLSPPGFDRVGLLDPDGRDVADPIGGDVDEYRRAARRIDQCLNHLVEHAVHWYEGKASRNSKEE